MHSVQEIAALQQAMAAGEPVGYYGLNMGTAIGVPLTAVEPRITVPVEFVLQRDDEHIERRSGLALFDAFASEEKTLHANAGAHKELPRSEADSAARFFARHLTGLT
jgi:hypothetical protein